MTTLDGDLAVAMVFYSSKDNHWTIEKTLGYKFKNKGYISKALITRSWWEDYRRKFDHQDVNVHYYPFNTLGDGVIDVIIMEEGIKLDLKTKGAMNNFKQQNVSKKALRELAIKINLSDFVMWNEGDIREGIMNRSNSKILSELFEAVIGAVFLDGGYEEARKVFFHIKNS